MVVFADMPESEFAAWKEMAIVEYAADKMKAGNDTAEGGVERSRREFESLLPDGLKTRGHHIMAVVDETTGQRIGRIWYADPPGPRSDMLWIYDIEIDSTQRGKGYGTAALKLTEQKARELGKKRMGLHVFAHNPRARELYEKLGYKATNISMAKELQS
jgi:GNAT superfamily N-acetyltransferase